MKQGTRATILFSWDALVNHITHNVTKKSQMHSQRSTSLVLIFYFHFDYSFKQKNIFDEFCDFCDQDYHKNLKFQCLLARYCNLHWEGDKSSIPTLVSLETNGKDGMESTARNNSLIAAYVIVLTCCSSTANYLKLSDPLIHIVYDASFTSVNNFWTGLLLLSL